MRKIKTEVIIDSDLLPGEVNDTIKSAIEYNGIGTIELLKTTQVISVYGLPPDPHGIYNIPFWMRNILNKVYKSRL